MTFRIFIDGGVGTTGLEIQQRLAGRPELEVITLDETARKDPQHRADAFRSADFAILCLPDDAAREAIALIGDAPTRVIDASTAHRVADGWTYGFPELEPGQAAQIAEARFVSNPGCWASAFLALVRPLVRAGLIPPDWQLSAGGASGYSGGGKSMIAEFEGGQANTAYRAYSLGLSHKHLPEMQRHARMEHPPIFQPAVANTYRGMLLEVALPVAALPRHPTLAAMSNALRDAYRDSPVIHLMEDEADTVRIEEVAGTDRMHLRVVANPETKQARLIATLDNLGKGAAGAAVQNLNIMAGLDPVAGLTL